MEEQVKERTARAMKELGISVNALANFRHLTRSTVNDQINGNSKIGTSTIEALLAYCPTLSAEWLLRGTGDMLLTNKPTEININDMGHHNTNIGSGTQTITTSNLAELKQQIAELKADKEKLYQLLLKQ